MKMSSIANVDLDALCNEVLGSREPQTEDEKNHFLFPKLVRCVVSGGSSSGKSHLVINWIIQGIIAFDELWIWSPSIHQPKYQMLKKYFEVIEEETGKKILFMYEAGDAIPDPQTLLGKDEAERKKNTKRYCFIFDDILLEKMTIIEKYFAYGRHSRVNAFILTQSFYHIKKSSIRNNMNMLLLFKTETKTLRCIYDSYISGALSFDEFRKFCKKAWDKQYGYITLSIDDPVYGGMLREGVDTFYIPEKNTQK